MKLRRIVVAILVAAAAATVGCGDVNTALAKLSEARHAAADLEVDFTRATDAANRAVMADTDEASVKYAQEANAAKQAVHSRLGTLRPLLGELGYTDEGQILQQFERHFSEYEQLDLKILELAVENTNLKAQRLSFTEGQAAADAFRDALGSLDAGPGPDVWRRKATAANAVAAILDIQALQAPHIADPEDAAMTKIEARMKADETAIRDALAALASLADPRSRATLDAASAALERFMRVNAQIVGLSRRNTNVRSLALSLNEKQQLIPPCQRDLKQLRSALDRHGYPKGRWE